jgi:hypothetical protein
MGRRPVLVAVVGVSVALVALIASSGDDGGSDDGRRKPAPARADGVERCPAPRVTDLRVRPVSEDGMRITVRGRAYVARGGIGSVEVRWGDHGAVIAHTWAPRQLALTFFEHRYPRPGAYRVTVVADASTRGCRNLQESAPATLRIQAPVRPTSRPSSL